MRAQWRPTLNPFPPNRPTRAQVRRIRRVLLATLVLVWATHLLSAQWAGGAHRLPSLPQASQARTDSHLVLNLRVSADARGPHITLADVAYIEWKGTPIAGVAELPIASAEPSAGPEPAQVVVRLEQIIAALEAAGVDAAQIQVHGPIRCTVRLQAGEDAPPSPASDESAMLEWAGVSAATKRPAPPADSPAAPHAAPPSDRAPARPVPRATDDPQARSDHREFIGTAGTVGETLRRDLAARLNLPVESIQLRFAGEDMPLAQRTGVSADDVRALSAGDLGDVAWTIKVDGREIPLMAQASATLTRAVAVQRIAAGQIVRNGDVIGRQAQINQIADRGLSPAQAAGQQAARQLEAGQVLRDLDLKPRLLVQAGQLISVQELRHGTLIRGLAKALEDGLHGQIVRARREGADEIVQVLVTSPQAGRIVGSAVDGPSASGEGDAIPAD